MDTPKGQNIIPSRKLPSDLILAVRQLESPMIYILIAASLITFYLGDYVDAAVIGAAVALNTFLGFFQERKAQKNLEALKSIMTPKAKLVKGATIVSVNAADLKEGDIVQITGGDRVPADGKIIEAVNLFINESILTGESVPVEKNTLSQPEVFMGTVVTGGRGKVKITQIGVDTKLGAIATTLAQTAQTETPLQMQLSKLARMLALIVVGISIGIFIIGLYHGEGLVSMFSLAVAIAVSAIPEGMAVSLTVILSVGMQRILKRKAIVRRLIAAETIGSITTLCVDKTGTLTEGIMRVVEQALTNKEESVMAAVFANNLDNPIDLALWEWAQTQDHGDPQKMTESNPRISEIPFDGTRKYMQVENAKGTWLKGAPEIVLTMTQMTIADTKIWLDQVDAFAKRGLRVIALAKKTGSHFYFLGLLGVSDPVRVSVRDALAVCRRAGIDIKVATGDYRLTSEVIMGHLGMDIADASQEILEGSELNDLTDSDLERRVQKIKLFCRVTPQHKLRIVKALQHNGQVVGMTGDGVNDAPALKVADIGVVVANASDVARETADLVLLDSDFKTIVSAIEEGRVMFANIRKVALYLLSDSFAEMLLVTTSILAFLPLPLTAIQILWINILSDGLPNLALAFEPREHDVMRSKPLPRGAPIINAQVKATIVSVSLVKSVAAYLVFLYILKSTSDLVLAQTIVFAIVGTGSLMSVFSMRSLSKPILTVNPLSNPGLLLAVITGFTLQLFILYHPWFNALFHTKPLGPVHWGIIVGIGLLLIGTTELVKRRFNKRG